MYGLSVFRSSNKDLYFSPGGDSDQVFAYLAGIIMRTERNRNGKKDSF
jgi:hypothetical protein